MNHFDNHNKKQNDIDDDQKKAHTESGWEAYVTEAKRRQFDKVCIIARANYKTIATSNPDIDIATSWTDKSGSTERTINENEELSVDWMNPKRTTFCFFGLKCRIVFRYQYDSVILGLCLNNHKRFVIAKQFDSIWFVCSGRQRPWHQRFARGFEHSRESYNAAYHVWNVLDQAFSFCWEQERIIWIGYLKQHSNVVDNDKDNHKNINADECFFAKLPKDIIVSILVFLKKKKYKFVYDPSIYQNNQSLSKDTQRQEDYKDNYKND